MDLKPIEYFMESLECPSLYGAKKTKEELRQRNIVLYDAIRSIMKRERGHKRERLKACIIVPESSIELLYPLLNGIVLNWS